MAIATVTPVSGVFEAAVSVNFTPMSCLFAGLLEVLGLACDAEGLVEGHPFEDVQASGHLRQAEVLWDQVLDMFQFLVRTTPRNDSDKAIKSACEVLRYTLNVETTSDAARWSKEGHNLLDALHQVTPSGDRHTRSLLSLAQQRFQALILLDRYPCNAQVEPAARWPT
ncbi:MAG: hypothetical protein GY892_18195 [Shimia sp.]|nr:hypothetical protein [Shimia sp.]